MLTVCPDYYPQFKCIASLCRHNCCIGWEIDIDPDTMEKYSAVGGEMGARLRQSIARDEELPHFILGKGERCPFLNGDNLCDLILHGGEGMLCQICADHPRFRNELPGRTEIGLGLCCEAAAKLIIDRREPVRLVTVGEAEDSDDYAAALLSLRDELFCAAQNRENPITGRMAEIMDICGAHLPQFTAAELSRLYLGLERLDEAWTERLNSLARRGDTANLAAFMEYLQPREHEAEQLLVYFLYRHITGAYDDGEVVGRAAFTVLSVHTLLMIGAAQWAESGAFTTDDMAELARMYSSEVEYSDENLDTLLDALC